jgi:thiol-disulfide isomerase/thioredoxin
LIGEISLAKQNQAEIFPHTITRTNFVNSVAESDLFSLGEGVNFFYSATCPHCKAEKEFLVNLREKYPEIEIKEYEVINNKENQKILKKFYEKYNVPDNERGWVPVTFTPTRYFVGFNEQTGKEIESCIKECLIGEKPTSQEIKIPIFGKVVDISKMSLPALTLTLGALDGFNPCAMWVLVVLISLLLSLRSRKKIALVGGTFIFASIDGLFNKC